MKRSISSLRIALWGQKGNFVDIPTDCPQRDERLGWTGDTMVFSGTACLIWIPQRFLPNMLMMSGWNSKKEGAWCL